MSRSYEIRTASTAPYNDIYRTYGSRLGLQPHHVSELIRRGLTGEQIQRGGYATKPMNSSTIAAMAIGALVGNPDFDLDGVPGYCIDDKSGIRTTMGTMGILIPVRNYDGEITSYLIRNDRPTSNSAGRITNKYVAFGTDKKTKGGKVWQKTHCPIIKGAAKKVSGASVRITEGILKADIATALDADYCIGMHGLNIPNDLEKTLEALDIQEIRISLDAGEDENTDMIRAKAGLIELAKKMGIDVQIETWNPEYGKGIDDVLANKHKDKITLSNPDEIENTLAMANVSCPKVDDWIYVVELERFINVKNFQSLKKSQFADKFKLEKIDAVNSMIAGGFKQVDSLTFLPKGELMVVEDGLSKLNEWRDPGIVPIEGDIKPFMDHVEFIFPDELQRNIFLDFIAYNIQCPGKKIMWALVIHGRQGIGKSYFGAVVRSLVGEYNTSTPENSQIHETFTGWQKKCQIVIIEELLIGGRLDLMNKLKSLITQTITKIREMHKEAYNYPNRFNFLTFTNHGNALLLDDEDRRYGILKASDDVRPPSYYDDLWKWTKKPESIQAMLHYFLNRDIRDFNPNAAAPHTAAKGDMVRASMTGLEEWMHAGIQDQCWPFDREIVIIRHLKLKDVCPVTEKNSDFKWAQALKKCGAIKYEQQLSLSDGTRGTAWLIGSAKSILTHLTPAELVKLYEKDPLQYSSENRPADLDAWAAMASASPAGKGGNPVLLFKRDRNPIKEGEPM